MDFWEAQRRARSKTTLYVTIFSLLTIGIGALVEYSMRYFAPESYNPPFPILGFLFLTITFSVAIFEYSMYKSHGGAYVALTVGARPANPNNFKEKQLLNIVEEMAIAASVPVPQVFVLTANSINAFAAGISHDNAAITVTKGSLDQLSRDELQGVVAHEMGHIHNGDMKISMRLAAMVMGFFFVLYIAMRLLQFSPSNGDRDKKGGNPIIIAALILLAAGTLTWICGSILKAAVSREREYLADASAVQFTRSTDGIANALRKIESHEINDMPAKGMAYSHLYFDDNISLSSIFATHPPLKKRIMALMQGTFEPKKENGST